MNKVTTIKKNFMPITSFSGEHAFLSNFSPNPVLWSGLRYPTAEHAFVAAKTEDVKLREAIAAIPTPGRAKRFGSKLKLRPDWERKKVDLMGQIVKKKFRQDKNLALRLINTQGELIEGNEWGDQFWGCVNTGSENVQNWVGDNYLGKILMEVRHFLYGLYTEERAP